MKQAVITTQRLRRQRRLQPRFSTGSSLLLVLILTTVLTMTVAVVSRIGISESRIHARSFQQLNADYAAESALQYATAQVVDRWQHQANLPANDLAPDHNPIRLDAEFLDFHAHSPAFHFDVDGGSIGTSATYLAATDPAYSRDLHRGKHLHQHSVNLYARATTSVPPHGTVRSQVMHTLQACDIPLFSYLLFYNMDLELHPGTPMTLNGPVHANGDIWLQSDSTLVIEGPLSASGQIHYGWYQSSRATQSGTVQVHGSNDQRRSFYQGQGSRSSRSHYWHSQTAPEDFSAAGYTGWRDFSASYWGGNLQDAAHSVPTLRLVGFPPVQATDRLNHSYALIEPNQPAEDPLNPGYLNPRHKGPTEASKYAYKAGLIIRLHLSADGLTQHDGTALPAHAIQLRSRPDQNNPESTATAYAAETGVAADSFNTRFYISFNAIARHNRFDYASANYRYKQLQVKNRNGSLRTDTDGNPLIVTAAELREIPLTVRLDSVSDSAGDPLDLRQLFESAFAACHYQEDRRGNPQSGFYDPRRSKGIDVVEINLEAFANILEATEVQQLVGYHINSHYNGIVYVEFPLQSHPSHRADHIVTSIDNTGLLLSNAARLPLAHTLHPAAASHKSSTQQLGFSLATNNALYVKGHFNADGNPATGSASRPDNVKYWTPNPPATLVADAIMPLSANWRFEESRKPLSQRSATFTEFNTALIQGVTPSGKNGRSATSGGSHNLPRFLESWQNNTEFRFRGAMAALYESEICTEGLVESAYSPPLRNWGFCDGFRQGHFPPGMPYLRFFQTTRLRHLTASEYESTVQQLW